MELTLRVFLGSRFLSPVSEMFSPLHVLGTNSSINMFLFTANVNTVTLLRRSLTKSWPARGQPRDMEKQTATAGENSKGLLWGGNLVYTSRSRLKVHPLTLAPQCLLLPTRWSSDYTQ